MKVVINKCYGGFSLSPLAVKKIAELKGKSCYFFKQDIKQGLESPLISVNIEEVTENFIFFAYSIPNPNEILKRKKSWHEMTFTERQADNKLHKKYSIGNRDYDRNDSDLVKCVEELGKKANGHCAKLEIVEIPDGTDFTVEEYAGMEHIAEKHQTWG